jgi:hypothetical protein
VLRPQALPLTQQARGVLLDLHQRRGRNPCAAAASSPDSSKRTLELPTRGPAPFFLAAIHPTRAKFAGSFKEESGRMDVDANAERAQAGRSSEPSATAVAAKRSSIPSAVWLAPATHVTRHFAAMRAKGGPALKNGTSPSERSHD